MSSRALVEAVERPRWGPVFVRVSLGSLHQLPAWSGNGIEGRGLEASLQPLICLSVCLSAFASVSLTHTLTHAQKQGSRL